MTPSTPARPSPAVRAGIYCRISSDPTGTGLGVARQEHDCRALARRLGWTVHDSYIDNDISAYSGRSRPQYQRLLADARGGRITAILAWHPDRLNRSPRELEELIDLLDGCRLHMQTVTAGFLDLSTPSGRAVARTLGAWARYESEHKSERLRAKNRERALAGLPHGNPTRRPFGYTPDGLHVVPDEAQLIRQMARRLLRDQQRPKDIAHWLNNKGVPRTGGRPWRGSTVLDTLANPRYAGWRAEPHPKGSRNPLPEFLAPAQWPRILTRKQVEQVQALRADPTLLPGSPTRFLLTGLARCGICGSLLRPVKTTSHGQPVQHYQCGEGPRSQCCFRLSITIAWLDDALAATLGQAVHDGLIQRVLQAGDPSEPMRRQASELTEQLAEIDHARSTERINHAQWRTQHGQVLRRLRRAEEAASDALGSRQLAALIRTPASFAHAWDCGDVRRRRAILRALVSDLTVSPRPATAYQRPADRLQIAYRP